MNKGIEIFICYAREDEALCQNLEKQLRALKSQGLIDIWYDRLISAGAEWEGEIDKHLNAAQIILLLVSPDFMASDYCYSTEMKRAVERHNKKEAQVIPVILRPTLWQGGLLGKLQALPTDAIPVVSGKWHSQDEAFFNVAEGIKKAINDELTKESAQNLRNDVSPSLPTNGVGQTSKIAEQSGRTEQVSQLTASEILLNRTRKPIFKRVTTRSVLLPAIFVLIVFIGRTIAYGQWNLPGTISLASVKNLNIPCLSSRDSGRYIGPGCGTVLPLELILTEIDTTHDLTIWHFKLALLQGTSRQ